MRCPILECRYTGTYEDVVQHLEARHANIGRSALNTFAIPPFIEIRAFRGYLRTYRHRCGATETAKITVTDYFRSFRDQLRKIITLNTSGNRNVKIQVSLLCQFIRGELGNYESEICNHFLNSRLKIVNSNNEFDNFMLNVDTDINDVVDIFQEYGSGWKLTKVLGCDIRLSRYRAIYGRCHIRLPDILARKNAIVNVRNIGNQCFKYAFLSVMHCKNVHRNRNRIGKYKKFENRYQFHKFRFPTKISDIDVFESLNSPKKIAINVFEAESLNPSPICIRVSRISPNANVNSYKNINLLLYHDHESGVSHYMGITSLSKLFGRRNNHKKTFCYKCERFVVSEKYKFHSKLCQNFKNARVVCPPKEKDHIIRFKEHHKKLAHEYVMYCDFESIMQTSEETHTENTVYMKKHTPSGFCLVLVSRREGIIDHVLYRGLDCVKVFFQTIQFFADRVKEYYNDFKPMNMLDENQEHLHQISKFCFLCHDPFTYDNPKVYEHDHQTCDYRGACHRTCNTDYTLKRRRIPCFFHNFRKYDLHLILGGFKHYDGEIKVIPSNFESYINIICNEFVLVDSMMFLNASLDTLVKRLKESNTQGDNFKLLTQFFGKEDGELLCRKGVYFYDFINDFSQFDSTGFPTKEQFYNVLSESFITTDEYNFADFVYNKFCKNLGDYHDLYLKLATILLADVMENFRDLAISHYTLDPAHYFTLSGYTWSCALHTTNVKLEQLTDVDQYEFFECGIRGGVSMISQRYAEANNKFMVDFDEDKPDSYIVPWDCNNLYGFILQSLLPVYSFKWMNNEECKSLTKNDIMQWDPNGNTGYVLMVDLEYPPNLHIRDNEFPLAPEKIKIK